MTLLEKLNKFPPILCRAVARKNRGREPMSLRDIADQSGLALSTVCELSQRRTWTNATLETIQKFSAACGVDLLHPRRHLYFIKHRKKTIWSGKNRPYYRKLLQEIAKGSSQKSESQPHGHPEESQVH